MPISCGRVGVVSSASGYRYSKSSSRPLWQVVPERLNELLRGPHAQAVMREMMTRVKLDIARLEAAAES